MVIAATVFTLYFGFIQLRAFGHAIALVKGDYSDPRDAGEVSHFQALATALSGTVGLGNIAGVAVAVSIGGTVPLLLKRFGIDPAVASGPILTTVTDICGFFLVLSFATLMLSHLT